MQEDEVIYDAVEETQIIEDANEDVVSVEVFEAFQAPTTSDAFNHALLNNREIHDAHPITAITGLREELDEIESLKTVYSDAYNVANYYKWKDAAYDEYGYFVSIIPGTSEIEVCGGSNIFGVSVEAAGFVGGENADIPRDNAYGLIATSGLVVVRCELEVNIGDCVVSNAYGYAKKADSNYGYRVLARENKGGVEYAVIALVAQADVTNELGIELAGIQEQVDANYKNIISAVNVANQAYNKVSEIDASNQVMSGVVNEAVGKVDGVVADVENLTTQVSNSALAAAQAKAIAESAATSAESMRNEAVTEANKALAETSELRKEYETKIAEIDTELDNTALELESTKEDILEIKEELQQSIENAKEDLNVVNNEIKNDIANTKTDLNEAKAEISSLQEELSPITSWPENSDNPTGIAGFVAKADEESVILGGLVEWQGETNKSIATFKQEVADNYATQEMVSTVEDNLSLFKQEVSDTYATQEMVSAVGDSLAEYKQEVTDTYATQEMVSSVDDALTSYKQEVEENYATQQMLSGVEDNITSFKQEVTDTYATQEMVTTVGDNLAKFQQEVKDDYATQEMVTSVDNALISYKQEVEKNYATQQMLSTVENNLASFQQEVKDDYATQQMVTAVCDSLASYKQEVGETYATQEMVTKLETDTSKALTDYKQEVGKTYATQEMVTKLETDTGNALTDYKQEVGNTYATQESLTALEMETTKAIAASEEKATETYASKSDLTSFECDTNLAMARIEQKADANGAYIQSTISNMDKYSVGPHSQAYGFTLDQAGSVLEEGVIYVPTESVTEEYNYTDIDGKSQTYKRTFTPHYLYKWGKVNGQYHWITVDKFYNDTDTTNTSAPAVYFQTDNAPSVSDGDKFGYWYTNGKTLSGTAVEYEPFTLYKWTTYTTKDDDGKSTTENCWVAVATLAGNSSNRAVSQIRQDANSIEMRVTDTEGNYTGLRAELTDTQSDLQTLTSWTKDKDGNQYNLATIKQTADNAGASIAQVVENVGEDGSVSAASIVTAVNNAGSSVTINADHIKFDGFVSFANTSDLNTVKNNAVYETRVEYALSSSETTFTAVSGNDGKWSTVAPTWRSGAYMWQRTTIVKGNGAEDSSAPTCIQGANGQDGTIDPNAKQVNTHTRTQPLTWWQEHADSACTDRNWTINAGQGYSNTHLAVGDLAYIVGVATGNNVANMTVVICGVVEEVVEPSESTAGKVTIAPSHLIVGGQKGDQGGKGNDAPKVVSEEKQFHTSTSNTTAPDSSSSGWATVPMNYEKGKYLWTRSVYTMDNGDTIKGDAYLDKNFTTISNWCKDNNEAYIDGANIYAGSVTADQIDTNGLQAEYIQSNDYFAGSIDSLVFTPRQDGTYKVGLKQGSISEIVRIPQSYHGEQVVEIDKDSFAYGKDIIKTLVIPVSVTIIPFGFLEGYFALEELHIPVHNVNLEGAYGVYFCNWFGMRDYETNDEKITPAILSKVYLLGRDGNNTVPENYFDIGGSYWNKFDVYLTTTIVGLDDDAFTWCDCRDVYHYGQITLGGNGQIDEFKVLEDVYVFPPSSPSGFRITSKEGEPMIDSPYFKVTQDGEVIANRGDIAGWGISEDNIGKSVDGSVVVGINSGNISSLSLVNDGEKSPVRFYAGALGLESNIVRMRELTFSSTSVGNTMVQSIDDIEDVENKLCVVNAKCLTESKMHYGDVSTNIELKPIEFTKETNLAGNPYIASKTVTLFPTWVTKDHIRTLSCTNGAISVRYIGDGQIIISSQSDTKPTSSVEGTIIGSYSFKEYLDVEISHTDSQIDVSLTPQISGTDYTLTIKYELDVKNQNFKVLQDGSLYARAANISGKIVASDGDIGNLKIDRGGLAYKDDYTLNDAGLKFNNSNAHIQIGNLSMGVNNEGVALLTTSGPLKILGTNNSSIELMTSEDSSEIQYIDIYLYATKIGNSIEFRAQIAGENVVSWHDQLVEVVWQMDNGKGGDDSAWFKQGVLKFTINEGSNVSVGKDTIFGLPSSKYAMIWFEEGEIAMLDLVEGEEVLVNGSCATIMQTKRAVEIGVTGSIVPKADTYSLGSGKKKWSNIYATTSTIGSSDRSIKNSIRPLDQAHDRIFDALQPVSYKFNDNTSDRTHTGLIAQDVKEAVENAGLTTQDFAAYCEWENEDGSTGCGLRYGEFISLCIDQIQKLKKRVEELEEKLNNTK